MVADESLDGFHCTEYRHGRNLGSDVRTSAFWGACLGDRRRTARLIQVAAALAQGGGGESGGTITSVIRDRHQAKAAYRLLDSEHVTHDAVIAGHCAAVLAGTAAPGDYLLIEDTTTIAYPSLKQTKGLGPIGEHFTRGLWSHQTLVVRMDWGRDRQELLGLLGQQVWARPVKRARNRRPSTGRGKESGHARQSREDRESKRWMIKLEEAGGALPGTTWTYVADRESDIYEVLVRAWVHGWSHVIRASHARALAGIEHGEGLLRAAAAAPVKGTVQVTLGDGEKTMRLQVRAATVTLRGPSRPASDAVPDGRLPDHTVNVVYACQIDAPQGVEPACWILLTDLPVDTLEQCQRVLAIYRRRWLVEELHKALKTGLKVEDSQLSDARRLGALIGVLSVVAVFLLQHKLAARQDPAAPLTDEHADGSTLAVLKKLDPPEGPPTRRWYWRAIAKLGGFQARPSDGDPGWLTLWRGWQTLMILVRGYELARTG